jgi:hypothetical protein
MSTHTRTREALHTRKRSAVTRRQLLLLSHPLHYSQGTEKEKGQEVKGKMGYNPHYFKRRPMELVSCRCASARLIILLLATPARALVFHLKGKMVRL